MWRGGVVQRQAGVVERHQLGELGVSAATARRRVRCGQWREVLPQVYLLDGHRLTDEARVRAAWLWADARCPPGAAPPSSAASPGPQAAVPPCGSRHAESPASRHGSGGSGAVLSGSAAAWWHGMLDRAPSTVEVCVPPGWHLRRPPAGIVVRRRALTAPDRCVRRGVAITAPALTALDAAVEHGSTFLDRALQRHVGLPALQAAHRRRFGTRGNAAARTLLAVAATGGESEAERILVNALRRARITGWVLGHPFERWTIDIAFPDLRIAVEVDGWAWHRDPQRQRNDQRKGNALTRAAWALLRFGWHDLTDRLPHSLALIDAEIRERGSTRAGVHAWTPFRGS